MNRLLQQLQALELAPGDYAVFGSGPLLVRGIIPKSGDLDVICRGAAWSQAKSLGKLRHDQTYGLDIVELYDGALSFGKEWAIGDFDIDALIDDAEIIEGLPFVKLEHVINYKRIRDSAKDQHHIQQLLRSGIEIINFNKAQ